MKIDRINISGFIGARCADMSISQPVTLVCGPNGSGISHRAIASKFGVSMPAISYIVRGDTWKHIGATQ